MIRILSTSTYHALDRRTVAEIQGKVIKQSGRHALSRLFHAKSDKEKIAAWKSDLNRILVVFNVCSVRSCLVIADCPLQTELAINTHTIVAGILQSMSRSREDTDGQNLVVCDLMTSTLPNERLLQPRLEIGQWSRLPRGPASYVASSMIGEPPPPPPRACYGREELIEKIVHLAENLTPIALIGAGGIGKTSAALTVLHDDRIKQRFGDNRRFIRCDQFPASRTHFLHRLSTVTGASIENPEDLTSLRSFLSSKKTIIVLDNAESILDVQGTNAQEIFAMMEELSQFNNICLCITSRTSTVPPDCKTMDVPTLSMEAAHNTFYRIYEHDKFSDPVNKILEQLDFHPLSITLLATVAQRNKWDVHRLSREWERRRTGILDTPYSRSLAATIELSLASPVFQQLGPDARGLLGVVAFFPQGVSENNIDWLFPTISNITNIFDTFCVLSLTYRNNGFVTMLAPLRDHLRPEDPKSSQFLSMTKESYFTRLSVDLYPDRPGFEEARWITSEDVNVEHLLDIFTSVDANSDDVWDACANFVGHLHWHKPRLIVLGPKIKGLPDDHRSKPECLFELSRVLDCVGNCVERKQLLTCALKLYRERGDDRRVAKTLTYLADAHRRLGFYEEGVELAKEGLQICERVGDIAGQIRCLDDLAWLLHANEQLDAAEEAASRAIDLLPEEGERFMACQCRRILSKIYRLKRNPEKATNHLEVALRIASSFGWHDRLFWIHHDLAVLFFDKGTFDDAYASIERAKSHTVNNPYRLARAMDLQARFLCSQGRFEEARSEILRAAEIFGKFGAAGDLENCEHLLRKIDLEQAGRLDHI